MGTFSSNKHLNYYLTNDELLSVATSLLLIIMTLDHLFLP